jgi:response regulator RpfG family c-di-GMP phosphodiesterase
VVALSDVYDALRSRRTYKPPFSREKAETIIAESRGVHFDPELVDLFLKTKEEFATIMDTYKEVTE